MGERRRRALIFGGGVAGLTSARALAALGWEVEVWKAPPLPSPSLVLKERTCRLLGRIWKAGPELWKGAQVLREKRVGWGKDGTMMVVPQGGVSIRSSHLAARLLELLLRGSDRSVQIREDIPFGDYEVNPGSLPGDVVSFDWVVDASGRSGRVARALGNAHLRPFGRRCVIGRDVTVHETGKQEACWIEAVPGGWVFLIPQGRFRAHLQAMVPRPPRDAAGELAGLLEQTRTIHTLVASFLGPMELFPAFPQVAEPAGGSRWIAVGNAALSLDPLGGDGVGNAARGAVLAAKVLDGIPAGSPCEPALGYYGRVLFETLARHLQECRRYYSSGFRSPEWQAEIDQMVL